jgi:hypothetical protein
MVEITDSEILALGQGPNQIYYEWKTFLQFIQEYFKKRGILNPVVVELGTQYGRQKAHYEKFLDAMHIGIDISDKSSKPDILGDTHSPETMIKLMELLGGKRINLLFIDATHTFKDVFMEYLFYGPLVDDIIALHDIRHEKEVGMLWEDLQKREKDNSNITFMSIGTWGRGWCELGIGVVIKHNREEIKEIMDEFRLEK